MTPGLATLMDETAAGAPSTGLADELWRLVYTRGHLDVDRARPYLDRDHAGILVYARSLDAMRALVIVETGDRLVWAAGALGPLPRIGSAVRLAAAGGSRTLRLIVDEALPLAVAVCFERAPAGAHERRWIGTLRDALGAIRVAESERRNAIALRRRALPPVTGAPAHDAVVRERVEALRAGAERETAYTADETAELELLRRAREAGPYAGRRRAFERETQLAQRRQERFDARMRAALDAFRTELPALHQRIRTQQAAGDAVRAQLLRCEDAWADSCARTRAVLAASRSVDALAGAPFVVEGLDAPLARLDEPARADDVLRAIALLARALPRAAARLAV
jgi:hypothetical protein